MTGIRVLLHKGSANLGSHRVWIFHITRKKIFFGHRTQTITTFLVFGVEQSFWYLGSSPARDLFIFAKTFRSLGTWGVPYHPSEEPNDDVIQPKGRLLLVGHIT